MSFLIKHPIRRLRRLTARGAQPVDIAQFILTPGRSLFHAVGTDLGELPFGRIKGDCEPTKITVPVPFGILDVPNNDNRKRRDDTKKFKIAHERISLTLRAILTISQKIASV